MKAKFTLLLLFVGAVFLSSKGQQIPNGNFSSWTAGAATGWYDIDQYLTSVGVAGQTLVSEDTNAANRAPGSTASAKLQTQLVEGVETIPAFISLGGFNGTGFTGSPYAYQPDSISFDFKYETVATDTGQYGFTFTKWNGTSETVVGGIPVGYADLILDTGQNFYHVTLSTGITAIPDSLTLYFISGSAASTAGNTLWIDNIQMIFATPTGFDNLSLSTTISLYPVPAAATLTARVTEELVNSTYNITDMYGNVVAKGIIESTTNSLDVSRLATGSYLYSVIDSDKRIAAQGRFMVNR